MRRVVNLGNSGSGKSRLTRALDARLCWLQGERAIWAFVTEIAP